MNLRHALRTLATLLLGGFCTGCANHAFITHVTDNTAGDGPLGGDYVLRSCVTQLPPEDGGWGDWRSRLGKEPAKVLPNWMIAEHLLYYGKGRKMFHADAASGVVPVKVVARELPSEEGCGVFAKVNNALSWCTFSIWPEYSTESRRFRVTAEMAKTSESVTYTLERRQLRSWFLTGWIPVFAWGDSRFFGLDSSCNDGWEYAEDESARACSLNLFTREAYERNK